METYEEFLETKKWLKEKIEKGTLTKEEVETYIKVIKVMYGKQYKCLECPHNNGNFQKGICYNCSIWD